MAKFTEQEKEQIYKCLLTKGRELFIKHGLSKTSIDDLVQACGISKGSFYKFFSSKEELFYIILQKQEEIPQQLMEGHLQQDLPPKELLSSFFHTAFNMAEENALLQQWLNGGEYERIIRKLPPELVESFAQDHMTKGIGFVQTLIDRGIVKNKNPELVSGIMKAVMMLRLFKDQLGSDFPEIMEFIIDCVAEGLA
jgi:AcrR family transcriptional regulator